MLGARLGAICEIAQFINCAAQFVNYRKSCAFYEHQLMVVEKSHPPTGQKP